MSALIGPIIALAVQLLTWFMDRKGKASTLDKKLLDWLDKKNEDSTKSVAIKEKIQAALKWAAENPISNDPIK